MHKIKYTRIPLLWFYALSLALIATFSSAPLRADQPITASQLSLSVQQSGVPQTPVAKSKDKDKAPQGTTVMRAVTINIRRVGAADGRVTLETTFIGLDVETKQKVVNSERTKEAEAVPGAGNIYTETSEPFTAYPRSVDPKTKTVTPARGTKPVGWVVQVLWLLYRAAQVFDPVYRM